MAEVLTPSDLKIIRVEMGNFQLLMFMTTLAAFIKGLAIMPLSETLAGMKIWAFIWKHTT